MQRTIDYRENPIYRIHLTLFVFKELLPVGKVLQPLLFRRLRQESHKLKAYLDHKKFKNVSLGNLARPYLKIRIKKRLRT